MDNKKAWDTVKRVLMLVTVVALVYLILNPIIWIAWGWFIVKGIALLLLATIVSRVVFKKSLRELIFGDD